MRTSWNDAALKVPARTNDFGQPLMDDYGLDAVIVRKRLADSGSDTRLNLTTALGDQPPRSRPQEAQMHTTTPTTYRLAADLDAKAPAKVRRHSHEPEVMKAKAERHTAVRIPDVLDEVTGEAVWFAEGAVIVVPMEDLNTFRAWISCRGLSTCGNGTYRVESLGDSVDLTWEQLHAAVRP